MPLGLPEGDRVPEELVDTAGRVPDSEAVTEGLGATDRVWEEDLVELGVSDPVADCEGI
jgi:hypothetical protein